MNDLPRRGTPLGTPVETSAGDFFDAIAASGALPVGLDAREAAAAVVCTLLGRLDLVQAREVLDALDPAVRAGIGACPVHGGEPAEALGKEAFLVRIGQHFELAPTAIEPMTEAVFHALRAQLPPGPADMVERELPAPLRALWRRLG